jgi:hypothetical protein
LAGRLALALGLAAVVVYANSFSGPFLFDDQNSIVGNTQIRQLWPLSIPLSPPRDTPVAGRPLVNLSFALNYAVHGLDVRGYHVVNLAIHVLAAITLFGVVRRTLMLSSVGRALSGSPREADNARSTAAFACALVWMLHPLQTESVNYLTERTESLMGLFYLLTLYCSIRGGIRDPGSGIRGIRGIRKWEVASVLSCAAGMLCKESMVTAPVMVVLYDRVFMFESWRTAFRARRGLYTGLAASWLVLAALLSANPRTSAGFETDTSPWIYLLNQFVMIPRYLWLTIWPRELVLDYGLPRPLILQDVLPQAALVVALGVATLFALVRWPLVGFLGAWFFITLAPSSSFVPIATEVGAERRMYLPLVGLMVSMVIAICVAGRKGPPDVRRPGPDFRTRQAILLAIALLLAVGTFLRNREYASRLSIAETIVERWPSGRGRYILGVELLRVGRRPEAMTELRASAIDYPAARYALGTELFSEGQLNAAVEELLAFLEAHPTHANALPAHDQLGRAYMLLGRPDQALEEFKIVLAQPDYHLRGEVQSLVNEISAALRR